MGTESNENIKGNRNKALLVIDVQNYFVKDKAAYLPEKIAGHIQESNYAHVLFVYFRNDPSSNFHKILNWKRCLGSPDTDLHEMLTSFVTEKNVFEKNTYSALKSPDLSHYLKKHDINTLDLCGISLDGCVLITAHEAFDLGYNVSVLQDLCSVSSSRDDFEDAAKIIIERNLVSKDVHLSKTNNIS